MGGHILPAAHQVPETVVNPISGTLPCGFCSRCGAAECAPTLKILS